MLSDIFIDVHWNSNVPDDLLQPHCAFRLDQGGHYEPPPLRARQRAADPSSFLDPELDVSIWNSVIIKPRAYDHAPL